MKRRFKSPVISDHGGDNYESGRSRITKLNKDTCISFRCTDCNAVRYVTRIELGRAAKPRCLKCGGTLVETMATLKKQLALKKEREKIQASRIKVTAEPAVIRCISCRRGFKNSYVFSIHLAGCRECCKTYIERQVFQQIGEREIITDTLHITQLTSPETWVVSAVGTHGAIIILKAAQRKHECVNYLELNRPE